MLPFAFLAGLLRGHVARLDAELRARLQELRASRARLVEASDTERRRLERNLHDGAQSRFVGLALLLGHARRRVDADPTDPEIADLLAQATAELQAGLADLRELARGIHPPLLTDQGLEPALHALAARAPVPVTLAAEVGERLPAPVEIAAYFVVAEALANVGKYARASEATIAVRRVNGLVTVDVADDGVGGADAGRGTGLRGPHRPRCRARRDSRGRQPLGRRDSAPRRDPLREGASRGGWGGRLRLVTTPIAAIRAGRARVRRHPAAGTGRPGSAARRGAGGSACTSRSGRAR